VTWSIRHERDQQVLALGLDAPRRGLSFRNWARDHGAFTWRYFSFSFTDWEQTFRQVVRRADLVYVSGYQLISEIRENSAWQHVPIVVLSGKVLERDIVKALDLGANDYVTKPFRPEELLARLRRIVADHERLGAGA